MKFLLCSIVTCILLLSALPCFADETFHEKKEVIVVVSHYPPWKIIEEDNFKGIDIELTRTLLLEVGYTPRFIGCPWIRGIKMLENGEADLISGILKRSDREKTMTFLEPPYKTKSSKAFFIHKNGMDITNYEDLDGKILGVQRGTKYFERFDNDITLNKQIIHNNELNFKKLATGRINALIITESIGDYLVAKMNLANSVRKASFRHDKSIPVYFAISKKSRLALIADELTAATKRLKENGEFDDIINSFFKKLHNPH